MLACSNQQCGCPNQDGAEFCARCGRPITARKQATEEPPSTAARENREWGAAVAAIGTLGVMGGILAVSDNVPGLQGPAVLVGSLLLTGVGCWMIYRGRRRS